MHTHKDILILKSILKHGKIKQIFSLKQCSKLSTVHVHDLNVFYIIRQDFHSHFHFSTNNKKIQKKSGAFNREITASNNAKAFKPKFLQHLTKHN